MPKESYRLPFKQAGYRRDQARHGRRERTPARLRAPFAGAAYESAGKTGTAQTFTMGKNEK
ncbi:hypothetical protein ACU4GD_09060 [Cupriavidus basilensis]